MIEDSLLKSAVAGRDGFVWWMGRVAHKKYWKDQNNALALSGKLAQRVKVRIVGYHPWDDSLPEAELPWAHVMMDPIAGSGQGMMGDTLALVGGETCIGFFMDGEEAQQPVVMGLLHRHAEVENAAEESTSADGGLQGDGNKFKPFTGHADGKFNATKVPFKQTKPVSKNSPAVQGQLEDSKSTIETNKGRSTHWANISDANFSVFGNLTDGQRSRILSAPIGSNTEGVNVTESLKGDLKNFELGFAEASSNNNLPEGMFMPNGEVSASQGMVEKMATKVHTPPSICGDSSIGQINQTLQDFITFTNGLESSLDSFIDPVLNKVVDIQYQIQKVGEKIKGIVKNIVNNIRDALLSKTVIAFKLFSALQKKINIAEFFTGPAAKKAATLIMKILFCVFEKDIMPKIGDFVIDLLKNLVGKVVNGPLCAIEQFTAGILNKVMSLIDGIVGPLLKGVQWLTGGLGKIKDVLGKVSGLARKIFAFLECAGLKCDEPSEWVSSTNAALKKKADNWKKTLDNMDLFDGVSKEIDKVAEDVGKSKIAKWIQSGDTEKLKEVKVFGTNFNEILLSANKLSGGLLGKNVDDTFGSIEASLSIMSLYGVRGGLFDECNSKIDNPTSQDDVVYMPPGFKYGTCIPPKAEVVGEGEGAKLLPIVGSNTHIFSVEIVDGGSGYDSSTTVAIVDKTNHGSGANAKALVNSVGVITSVVVTSAGRGYCGGSISGGGGGVGILTSIYIDRPGYGYTAGDFIVITDPINPGIGYTTAFPVVTPGNGSIVEVIIPPKFKKYEFTQWPDLKIVNGGAGGDGDGGINGRGNGRGASLIPVMQDIQQSYTDDTVKPLIGMDDDTGTGEVVSVIDCPTEDHRS